jgi:hypothetical protein
MIFFRRLLTGKRDEQERAHLAEVIGTIRHVPEEVQPSRTFIAETRDWILQMTAPISLSDYRAQKADGLQENSGEDRVVA